MGILKYVFRVQGPEERECRRESESPGPADVATRSLGFAPLTNRNVIQFLVFVKCFVKNIFGVCFSGSEILKKSRKSAVFRKSYLL